MDVKIIKRELALEKYSCTNCGYKYTGVYDLDYDELERVPCCPVCKTLIESEYDD